MKREKNAKNAKKVKSAIAMSMVSVLMLTGATYAWFTLSNYAHVRSMSLKVATEGNLLVSGSKDFTGAKDDYDLQMSDSQIIYPCTTTDGTTMLKPVYSDSDTVTNAVSISESDKSKYYYEKKIWLKVDEGDNSSQGETYAITLAHKVTSSSTNGKQDGTYIVGGTGESAKNAELCARVSFEVANISGTGKQVAVYEPNSNGTIATKTQASDKRESTTAFSDTHKQLQDGTFTDKDSADTYTFDHYTGDSNSLFLIKGSTPTEVTIRVWFEGTDAECCNEIEKAVITGQLKFVSHKITSTTNSSSSN